MFRSLLCSLLFFVVIFQVSCAPVYYDGPISDHFDGQRFFYPGHPRGKSLKDSLLWAFNRKRPLWPEYRELPATDKPPERVSGRTLRVSCVGHSTVFLQTRGLNILLDPVWSDRASPVRWAGPKRAHSPGIRFEDLPPIDVVLITHSHYDHMDIPFLGTLWQRDHPRIIAPLGNESVIKRKLPHLRVETYDWGDLAELGGSVRVHLVPALHWSARNFWDRRRALWASFVLETPDGNLYLVGDTAYGDGEIFRKVASRYGPFRLAVLPIGAYLPRWFMRAHHMAPHEAVQAHLLLGAAYSVPLHYGTFSLADDRYEQPLVELQVALQQKGVVPEQFRIVPAGTSWQVP